MRGANEVGPQVVTTHDHVDEPVLQKNSAGLEALRELGLIVSRTTFGPAIR